ncbi:uncharacterized protein P884DRAFT_263831 [Thermothelomyces heterothallicus CBS 202.75]|uniref:uncharacterized protein n=1 Tax=Thermothelomyces heterothallicus CBS 202.75 TaxID=1149848 RepID=UPI003744490E
MVPRFVCCLALMIYYILSPIIGFYTRQLAGRLLSISRWTRSPRPCPTNEGLRCPNLVVPSRTSYLPFFPLLTPPLRSQEHAASKRPCHASLAKTECLQPIPACYACDPESHGCFRLPRIRASPL